MRRPVVSHHAIVRYLERKKFDEVLRIARSRCEDPSSDAEIVERIEEDEGTLALQIIRNRLGGGDVARVWRALGDGRFPAEEGFVQIREGVVVTYMPRLKRTVHSR